jgi:hypothetical protein
MDDTYLSSVDISYDVLRDAYLLDILVHAFGMRMGYIVVLTIKNALAFKKK